MDKENYVDKMDTYRHLFFDAMKLPRKKKKKVRKIAVKNAQLLNYAYNYCLERGMTY